MTPEILDIISGSKSETDKYIEFSYGYFVIAKQTGEAKIKIFGDNGKISMSTLYKLLLASDLFDILFYILPLMNLVHTCLFH